MDRRRGDDVDDGDDLDGEGGGLRWYCRRVRGVER